MIAPPTIAKGNKAASRIYSGKDKHSLSIRVTPKSLDLDVHSRDRLMILAIVALRVDGFVETIPSVVLILR